MVVAENNRKIKNYCGNSLTFFIKQLILVFVNTGIYYLNSIKYYFYHHYLAVTYELPLPATLVKTELLGLGWL